MKKTVSFLIFCFVALILSGCGFSQKSVTQDGKEIFSSSIYKSSNGGDFWEPQQDEIVSLSGKNILSLSVDYQNEDRAFFGSEKNGILRTEDGGKTWKILENFRARKVYGLDLDKNNSQIIYASGVWQDRGKIYKSENGGRDWKEIYTEAAEGPVVTALVLDKKNPSVVYAANSEKILVKSLDGGETWKNIFKASSPIVQIVVSPIDSADLFLLTSDKDVYRSTDGGRNFLEIDKKIEESLPESESKFYTGVIDFSGVVYLGGNDGIIKSLNNGESWERIRTLSDSQIFPVRALDVNPKNSREIICGAARAIYKSKDGGVTWSAFQIDSSNIARVLKYSFSNPQVLYFALFDK